MNALHPYTMVSLLLVKKEAYFFDKFMGSFQPLF